MRFLLLILLFSLGISAQKPIDPAKIIAFNITVNTEQSTIKTQMLKNPKQIKIIDEADYLWYSSNKIMETKGGYDGKLIHGYYKSFYLSNQLKEKGKVKYGLKSGEWRYWYENGLLKEIITWKNGKKNGKYILFNEEGGKMASGKFKNDLLHGKFITYAKNGKVLEKKKFRNGNELVKKPKHKKVKEKKRKETKPKEENKKSETKKRKFGDKLKSLFKAKKKKSESNPSEVKQTVS